MYRVPPVTGLPAADAAEPDAIVTPTASAITAVEAIKRRLVLRADISPPCRNCLGSRP